MSVKELKLVGIDAILHFKHGTNTENFGVAVNDKENKVVMILNRSEAHLLMLYLQEHLK